jgi:hypothetical protein
VVLDALVRDSIAKYGGNQCQVLSDLNELQNRQDTVNFIEIESQLAHECHKSILNELESIDNEIAQMDPGMDLTHARAKFEYAASVVAKCLYKDVEDSAMSRYIKNLLIIVEIELNLLQDLDTISKFPQIFPELENMPHENWVTTIENNIRFMPEGFKTLVANLKGPITAWIDITSITEMIVRENLREGNLRYNELLQRLGYETLPTDLESHLNTLGENIKNAQLREQQDEYSESFGYKFNGLY